MGGTGATVGPWWPGGELLCRGKTDTLLLTIPDGVVCTEEGVAEDPNRDASIHALDAKLALLLGLGLGISVKEVTGCN